MRAEVLVNYGLHKKGDIIEVSGDGQPGSNYYAANPIGDKNAFYPSELKILPPDDPAPSAVGGPPGATSATMRTFGTGATRSNDAGKIDPEGFLSPLVIERYCQYLNKHRVQADGKLRDSDNWQRGMGKSTYMKSAWRHFLDMWKMHRTPVLQAVIGKTNEDFEDSMCAVLFNVMGYLHEHLKEQK